MTAATPHRADASWAFRHELLRPTSIEEAVAKLTELGGDAAPLAGATWIMRSPLRGERMKRAYVALNDIEELRRLELPNRIGSLVTHEQLSDGSGVLAEAARASGPRAIRNVATVGGSVCAHPFPESDIVVALLALDAELSVVSAEGERRVTLVDYLAGSDSRPAGELVTAVALGAPAGWPSVYERLSVRDGSEYAVASAAVALDIADGVVRDARVAVGSVETVPRRIAAAEQAVIGRPAAEAATVVDLGGEVVGRDAVDAPGWYREAVLPALIARGLTRASNAKDGNG